MKTEKEIEQQIKSLYEIQISFKIDLKPQIEVLRWVLNSEEKKEEENLTSDSGIVTRYKNLIVRTLYNKPYYSADELMSMSDEELKEIKWFGKGAIEWINENRGLAYKLAVETVKHRDAKE